MSDLIERQAAIDEAEEWIDAVYCDHDEQRERDAIRHVINGIKELPSAQPYTEAEIQKMQELEQAELQKAYECGRASAQPEIIVCADCKHWICHDKRCGYWNHDVKPLDWCCHAERRTG